MEAVRPVLSTPTARPRVLYLTHRVPFPPNRGDRIRNLHLLRQLSERASVSLLAFAEEPVPEATRRALLQYCERVEIIPITGKSRWLKAGLRFATGSSLSESLFRSGAADRILAEWQHESPFTSAVVSASSLAPYLRRNGLEQVPGFVDVVDVDSQKWFDYAEASSGWRKWVYRTEGNRVRRLERSVCEWAEGVAVVSPAEATLLNDIAGRPVATVAPHGVDLQFWAPGKFPPISWMAKSCLFVGAMNYRPNIDAVTWFAETVWPSVRQVHPDATFVILGQNPTRDVWKLNRQERGISVLGAKADVRPWVEAATVSVAPLRLGRGVQNKVLEAMAMGKAVVASPTALMGILAKPGRDVLSANEPAEWSATICELFADAERRTALGQAARSFVESNADSETGLAPFLDAIAPLPRAT